MKRDRRDRSIAARSTREQESPSREEITLRQQQGTLPAPEYCATSSHQVWWWRQMRVSASDRVSARRCPFISEQESPLTSEHRHRDQRWEYAFRHVKAICCIIAGFCVTRSSGSLVNSPNETIAEGGTRECYSPLDLPASHSSPRHVR